MTGTKDWLYFACPVKGLLHLGDKVNSLFLCREGISKFPYEPQNEWIHMLNRAQVKIEIGPKM